MVAACTTHATITPPATRAGPTPSASTASNCRLLTQAQVQAALGVSIDPAKPAGFGGCLFTIGGGAGTVTLGITTYPSATQAHDYLKQQTSFDSGCCHVTKINALGQQAMSVTGNTTGTSVLAVFGPKVLTVTVAWHGAVIRPGIAVTLAREASGRV
jgi:hypothetical protein